MQDYEEFLKDLLSYQTAFNMPVEFKDAERINPYYVECAILPNGMILQLRGSHQDTVMRYLGIKWSDVNPKDFDQYWLANNYKVVMVHSHNLIIYPKSGISKHQLDTLRQFNQYLMVTDEVLSEAEESYRRKHERN